MSPTSPSMDEIRRELLALRDRQRSVLMATVSADGEPEASYAPYLFEPDGTFYVFLSELARHARNLLAEPRVSLLFVEPENEARQIFARQRLSYACVATPVPLEATEWEAVIGRFEQRFGPVVAMLRGLSDFRLFRLEVRRATYVRGFGQAYSLEGPSFSEPRPITAERLGRRE